MLFIFSKGLQKTTKCCYCLRVGKYPPECLQELTEKKQKRSQSRMATPAAVAGMSPDVCLEFMNSRR